MGTHLKSKQNYPHLNTIAIKCEQKWRWLKEKGSQNDAEVHKSFAFTTYVQLHTTGIAEGVCDGNICGVAQKTIKSREAHLLWLLLWYMYWMNIWTTGRYYSSSILHGHKIKYVDRFNRITSVSVHFNIINLKWVKLNSFETDEKWFSLEWDTMYARSIR